MAYTRTWAQVLNLLGARDADEIDDASREAHLDFTERFSDILYDVTAFPWKVRIPGVAVDGHVSYGLPAPSAVVTLGAVTRNSFDVQSAVASPGSSGLGFPVQANAGSTIVQFEIKGYRTVVDAVVSAVLVELDSTTEVSTVLATVSLTLIQAGIQIAASGLINALMNANKSYYISVQLAAGASGLNTARLSSVYYTVKLAGV